MIAFLTLLATLTPVLSKPAFKIRASDKSGKKSKISRIFRGKFEEKSADLTGISGGNFAKKQSVKNR